MSKREIFMVNGRYDMCDLVWYKGGKRGIEGNIIVCRDPKGRLFAAEQMYGTWGECRGLINDVTELHYENNLPLSNESGEDFYIEPVQWDW